jgi:hypothetical protein
MTPPSQGPSSNMDYLLVRAREEHDRHQHTNSWKTCDCAVAQLIRRVTNRPRGRHRKRTHFQRGNRNTQESSPLPFLNLGCGVFTPAPMRPLTAYDSTYIRSKVTCKKCLAYLQQNRSPARTYTHNRQR